MQRRKLALGAAIMALGLSAAPVGAQVALPDDVAVLLPAASTCEVTVLDSDSVRVTGTVDPNTLATAYRVEYGLLGVLNLSSATLDVGSSPDPSVVTTQLDDLVQGSSYSCRIVALNLAGETAGSTTTFVVPGADGTDGSDGSNGSGGTGATPTVNPVTGQVVAGGTADAVRCTITGTAGRDRLKGTRRRDVICGLGGADRMTGLAGNDTLIGGPGNDRLRGKGGTDRLVGNGGKDRLSGGKGPDRLSGGRGADFVFGRKGRDRMSGGRGRDRFAAHRDRRGGDRLRGGRGRDRASLNRGDRMRSIERAKRRSS